MIPPNAQGTMQTLSSAISDMTRKSLWPFIQSTNIVGVQGVGEGPLLHTANGIMFTLPLRSEIVA
jgi:hypothetical protein